MKKIIEPLLLILAILAGIASNQLFTPINDLYLDYAIYLLLIVVFASIPFHKLIKSSKDISYLSIAWFTNFIIIPVIAFTITILFVDINNLLFLGLIIYLIAPCTDWVVGFTKLAKGDVERNTILLPINLLTQLIYLSLIVFFFSNQTMQLPFEEFINTLTNWILIPFLIAQIPLVILRLFNLNTKKVRKIASTSIIYATAILVYTIFFVNTNTVIEHINLLPTIFIVILLFFISTYFIVRLIAKTAFLNHEKEVSLAMTTAARNAPLMLGLTLALFPEATIIHTVLIVGMLVEFPHLITLTYLMKKQ